ncbi:MAG: multidrug ABC transporter ATP-binding protein [Anaerolineaceae bacterium]|nr:multidrug ABC transporter ATP-binding protein [Anaerolineaceae bacterium]
MDHPEASTKVNNSVCIHSNQLSRKFRKQIAVDCLNLTIPNGELFGLVGPDGAGKTTILRLLAGLLHISSGEATVLGYDLKRESDLIKKETGYMAQQFSLYGELSVEENLLFFSDLFDVDPVIRKDRMKKLLAFAGLTQFQKRPAALLSGGMQKKLALACTMIHEPKLLLLDEPTTGVDPISRREFWDILSELHLQGTTIIVSTPYMDEADRCSRVGLLFQGKLVECASPTDIRAMLPGELIEIIPDDWQKATEILSQASNIKEVQTYGETIRVLVDSAEKQQKKIERSLINAGIQIRLIRKAPAKMEDAFISLIGKLEG